MEILTRCESSFDNFFTNACGSYSDVDVTACTKRGCSYYDPSFLSNSMKEEPEVDDSREDAQSRSASDTRVDDIECIRLTEEEPDEFSISAFLLPLLPFAYVCEDDPNDEIFRARPNVKKGNSEIANLTLYRCHAWSLNSHSPGLVSLISIKEAMEEGLVRPDDHTLVGRHSALRVLHWDELVNDPGKISFRSR